MVDRRVLVTGATGYVGGRLIPHLLRKGYKVRAVSRNRQKLVRAGWADHNSVELREADALDYESTRDAVRDCTEAYYLIHSMGMGSGDFAEADRRAARNFVEAAEASSVERVVYLGGLGHYHEGLSKHRQSRREVGHLLQEGSVPVTILRAAMIIGAGSGSFELTRYCVEKMPLMLTHPYVKTQSQPIAVNNVLTYLVQCLDYPETAGEAYDIGGPDVLSGIEVMQTYARVAGLWPRLILPLPFISLDWSARWITKIVPLPDDLTYPLVKGSKNPAIVEDDRIEEIIPQRLLSVDEAMRRALARTGRVSDTPNRIAESIQPPEWPRDYDPDWAGGTTYVDERTVRIDTDRDAVWNALIQTGKENGLFFAKRLRNAVRILDDWTNLFGFPDGIPTNSKPEEGDNLDWWTVERIDNGTEVELKGEFRLPGEPRLTFRIEEDHDEVICRQRAEFRPSGLLGRFYWSIISLFHYFSFDLMLENIAQKAGGTSGTGPVRVEV